jgi:hypothetical protein
MAGQRAVEGRLDGKSGYYPAPEEAVLGEQQEVCGVVGTGQGDRANLAG